jgi:beta-glucosidase
MTDFPAKVFPQDFLWGASTSSYQIEGAVKEDGRGESIWDVFCRKPGVIRNGDTGEVADDHYHRWPEDIQLMAGLGLTAYRFSIAWPRVQPAGSGPVNTPGLDFYERLTDALLAAGITPVPTLYHWDLPQALQDQGGWMSRDTAHRFAEYSALVAARLADRIGLWITLNEPFVTTVFGYALGIHAPGRSLMMEALPTAHHQLLGHGLATGALRSAGADQVMIANSYSPAWAATEKPEDVTAAATYAALHNWIFTDPLLLGRYPDLSGFGLDSSALDFVKDGDLEVTATPVDAIGVNYYNPTRLSHIDGPLPFQMEPIPGYPVTEYGWPVIPDGLREFVVSLRDRYGSALPAIYITENGCSAVETIGPDGSVSDPDRISYLDGHLRSLREAMDAGLDVRGYFAWSLLDNFEWAEGYGQRYGLVRVDYQTLERTPKASYHWYRDVIASQRG